MSSQGPGVQGAKGSTVRAVCVAVLIVAALVGLAARQSPPPEEQRVFKAGTTLVPVDVRVVDRDGRPVTDLKASDFSLIEDDVAQSIAHFSTQVLTPEPPAPDGDEPAGPRRAVDALEFSSNRSRTFLIVLGRGRLQPPSGGVDAAIHLVQARLLPQDQVAVLAWNRASDFTTDHDDTRRVLERFKRAHENLEMRIVLWERSLQSFFNPGSLPEDIQRDVDAVFGGARGSRALTTELDEWLDQKQAVFQDVTLLYLGVDYLKRLAGEKHLLYVSEFGVNLRGMDGDRHLGRLAADARVALDIIHAGGVPFGMSNGLSTNPPGLGMTQAMTGRNLSQLTGGSFFHHKFPNASMDVDRIDAATRFGYLLGFYPSNDTWDGKYRRIKITLNRRGLTVQHRDGYFAERDLGSLDHQQAIVASRIAAAAAFPRPVTDLHVTAGNAVVTMAGKTGQVTVDLTIDLSRVFFEPTNGTHHGSVDVAVFCSGPKDDEPAGERMETIELILTDVRLAELRRTGLTHTMTIPVTAVPPRAKVVVYDYGADLLGTAVVAVTRQK